MTEQRKGSKGPVIPAADWVANTQHQKKRRCCVCREETTSSELQEILKAINAAKAFKISVQAIYDRICEVSPGYGERVGFHNFRAHLTHHEPLWHRTKVRQS